MPASRTPRHSRLDRRQKFSLAGIAAVGTVALALSVLPDGTDASASPASVSTQEIALSAPARVAVRESVAKQHTNASQQAKADAAAAAKTEAKKKAREKAAKERTVKQAASRSVTRTTVEAVAAKTYPNNLDGWIRESLDVMAAHGIPGSYNGIHRNIIRESSGNPNAINNWDINAINGVPSKGLLQVIQPTFNAYHVPGTSWNIYDPVANITAACNYAAARYGSMDNVFGAY